eukprot:3885429-Rhodomonas_salina.3
MLCFCVRLRVVLHAFLLSCWRARERDAVMASSARRVAGRDSPATKAAIHNHLDLSSDLSVHPSIHPSIHVERACSTLLSRCMLLSSHRP